MFIVHSDAVVRVEPNTNPNYNSDNSLVKLLKLRQKAQLGAEREHYLTDSLQYLFAYDYLELYGPSTPDTDIFDPTQQDNKNDFQKQNVKDFRTTDSHLIRGLVTAGDWTGPFLRLSYRGGPDSKLSQLANHQLKDKIKLFLKVNNGNSAIITVPYNETSDRYEV